ncbi:ATP-binding protein [Nonomuraea endophytica]|uniref:Anti-sigma regulatory factor (Ser/Thr protein kinase) n=1 Tax=Nonomuraea endophytica TaxID=714136 RepID=A0A7W8A298_9ACTN|nr:ATP-binding protein [Nonomuraea endophytica]MBB5077481.1 anti-sigma regulatory factor (Ser/Thr protein kinase) [Nonomuraea endophytica]
MNGDTDPRTRASGPPPGAPVSGFEFTLSGLPEVRFFAETRAREAGLHDDEAGDLVLAVNEVATNAVTHGSATARIRSWSDGGDLVIEIHDHGAWTDEDYGRTRPAPNATRGMGLWVARLLSAGVQFHPEEEGTTVILRFTGKA